MHEELVNWCTVVDNITNGNWTDAADQILSADNPAALALQVSLVLSAERGLEGSRDVQRLRDRLVTRADDLEQHGSNGGCYTCEADAEPGLTIRFRKNHEPVCSNCFNDQGAALPRSSS